MCDEYECECVYQRQCVPAPPAWWTLVACLLRSQVHPHIPDSAQSNSTDLTRFRSCPQSLSLNLLTLDFFLFLHNTKHILRIFFTTYFVSFWCPSLILLIKEFSKVIFLSSIHRISHILFWNTYNDKVLR